MAVTEFAERLLAWWEVQGRHDLPWQLQRTPYRVWVAEVMLQQTQVTTVIGYFDRFMKHFPDLESLAAADLDDVLALWSGLGYYARGRNLHKTALICRDQYDGQLPNDANALENLPGIGRSTACAIVAQAFDQRAPILDGNVKRVVARHAGIAGWPGRSAVLKALWDEAERRTPPDRAAVYTQAIMDLGATLCTARNPACERCPVRTDCRARIEQRINELPGRKPRRPRREKSTTLLLIQDQDHRIMLERRPPSGIWGGLWSLPEETDVELPENLETLSTPPTVQHDFTHFRLHIQLRHVRIAAQKVPDRPDQAWWSREQALDAGLPRPIRSIIESLV